MGGEEDSLRSPTVRTATAGDEAAAIATIVLAFAADPVARWPWPHAQDYLAGMPGSSAHSRQCFCAGRRLVHGGLRRRGAVAPARNSSGRGEDGRLLESTVSPSLRGDIAAAFEQMAHHHPSEPHWYLPLIGVDPAHQGQGHGDALMAHALARCDRDRAPAYLESTNPRNLSLYLRHGFEALGTIRVGSSPPLVPMVRRPR